MSEPVLGELTAVKGTTTPVRVECRDGKNSIFDLTGCRILFLIKDSAESEDTDFIVSIDSIDQSSQYIAPLDATGIIDMLLASTDLASLSTSKAYWFVFIVTLTDSQVKKPAAGRFRVMAA